MKTKIGRPVGPEGPKTIVLSLKVTPKLRFGLEMLSRMRNSSVPELVTIAVNKLFDSEDIGLWEYEELDEGDVIPGRIYLLEELWDELPSNRFANVSLKYPNLSSVPEMKLWEHVRGEPKYWSHKKHRTEKELLRNVLAADWEGLKASYLI